MSSLRRALGNHNCIPENGTIEALKREDGKAPARVVRAARAG